MTILEIIILALVAGVCGILGQAIAGYSLGGFVVSIALGFIGALLGMWIQRNMNLPEPFMLKTENANFPIVWSIAGSALFVAIISFISRGRRSRK